MASNSKKRLSEDSNGAPVKKKFMPWQQGLLDSMNDPDLKVDEDDKVVTIKDKYPKVMRCQKSPVQFTLLISNIKYFNI